MIGSLFENLKAWISGLWTPAKRDAVLSVVERVAEYLDQASEIVAAVDVDLKPMIYTGHLPKDVAVHKFMIERQVPDADAFKFAMLVKSFPSSELFAAVAVYLLLQLIPKSAGTALARLAIELAYNIYKEAKK